MASDELYESCLPILQDTSLEEEDKTDKVEDLVRKKTELTGKPLENAVLDLLWRHRASATSSASPPAMRHTVIRRTSPAPWQTSSRSATPSAPSPLSSAASPAPSSSLPFRPPMYRMKSSQQGSAFSSPRPSPRPAHVAPQISNSPSPNPYDFNDYTPVPDIYGDYSSENVDWMGGDDGASNASFGSIGDSAGGRSDWASPKLVEMGPYDILRSVLRDDRSDEEIERVLEVNGYDLSAAIASLMDQGQESQPAEQDKTYLIGKSLQPSSRPQTPAGQSKSNVICRYWLSTGQCLRADCRFSHDLSNHVCKYWLAGNCLAGESCIFSHDPSNLMDNMSLQGGPGYDPNLDTGVANVQIQDYDSFPSLQGETPQPTPPAFEKSLRDIFASQDASKSLPPEFVPSANRSRPSSRHQSPAPNRSGLGVDDSEAFPSLGSTVKSPKKHHGKRGHGHGHREKENAPGSLADVVRMSPGNAQSQISRRSLRGRTSHSATRENSVVAQAIPAPEHIPWLETGDRANKAYIKARQEAIRHGGARNKFLQSAAQAWNRNDVRAAKALSLRGQSENDLMREAHREAAHHLYEERNKHPSSSDEVYIDLHGLHPAEAVSYLASTLSNQRSTSAVHRDAGKYVYAIVGTGHHSKGGRDKVGKAIRAYLNECRYAFREFSVPGDRGGTGGILGIDITSGGESKEGGYDAGGAGAGSTGSASKDEPVDLSQPTMQHGKVRILRADER